MDAAGDLRLAPAGEAVQNGCAAGGRFLQLFTIVCGGLTTRALRGLYSLASVRASEESGEAEKCLRSGD